LKIVQTKKGARVRDEFFKGAEKKLNQELVRGGTEGSHLLPVACEKSLHHRKNQPDNV